MLSLFSKGLVRGRVASNTTGVNIGGRPTTSIIRSYATTTSEQKQQQQVVGQSLRGKERLKTNLKVGDKLHGFSVVNVQDVPERQFNTFRLKHDVTGADYLHIDCEDKNNVFAVTFKTTPFDSTGVAHILEHTTLCGSKKYPMRDPFFNMLKRSLNTYMNAWTAPDHTSYPFGTQHEKDYYNLLSVYLDATFFPLLTESDFRQEGHRLEFEQLDNPESKLKFKGIVFNEMKGALSDPSGYFSEIAQQSLYPGTTYAHNSGGDPKDIPALSYQQLKDFHATYYHPSNAFFFTYGDLPVEQHLRYIEENALQHFKSPKQVDSKVNHVQRWDKPRRITVTCPPSAMDVNPERKHKLSISILHKDNTDIFEGLSMNVLSNLLIRGSNTPMYQALLESGLALDYTPNTGFDDNLHESSFGVGGTGIRKEDLEKVEQTIISTMEKASRDGFDSNVIESILHQYEFGQKDVSASLGLKLVGGLQSNWIHGGNPINRLFLNENIARLRKEIAAGPFFQNKLRQLLDNPHRLTITMSPDDTQQAREAAEEENVLLGIKSSLDSKQVETIVEQAKDLQQRQSQQQDVSSLPKLSISEIEKKQQKTPFIDEKIGSTDLRLFDFPTNGITYFRSMIDISTLPEDLKMYVPLFCSLFESMGAAELDHKQLDTEINLYTGRMNVSPMISTSPFNLDLVAERIYIKSAAINRNIEKMFSLLKKMMLENRWNNPDLLKNLLGQMQSSMIEGITSSGLSYARTYSSSQFSRAGQLSEKWHGLTHVKFTNDIIAKNDLNDIIAKLIAINKFILDRSLMRCSITTEKDTTELAKQQLSMFLQQFNENHTSMVNNEFQKSDNTGSSLPHYFAIPATVNYISKSYQGVNYSHEDSARLEVLSKVLSEYLHKEIREKGGAYGGGVSYASGSIGFYSYRDPNLAKTINAFNESIEWSQDKITLENVENAQLSIFADFDAPESPSNKGVAEWMRGITDEMKQQRRDRLLSINKNQLEEVSAKYLNPQKTSYTTVLGKPDTEIKGLSNKEWEYKELN
ncbi:peptidase M16 family protein [Heterostelium album PN500]|uniref:Presequence protease, mitochondrial n=1 Tax=Heterostelium pallidum (strain ATCC 26659 / Pp 5 / PN500) TaxID=670386 RepID=D3BQU1_HETP5|nr:peptidase M16 family protein [Heterostelium album PN500]EFA76511.1 peptidase M16 family protein [Heterostelium album PN500]|eukprot:XP_020428643.1 peptidase M16 family protein [Heterostelium album PN500]